MASPVSQPDKEKLGLTTTAEKTVKPVESNKSLKPPDADGGVAPGGAIGGFSLASMAYTPGTSPAKSPQLPRSPTPRRLVAPSSLTANSQDIKKKFDSVDLNKNKFKNKGSFYNRFPVSPESPNPPSSHPTPNTNPSKPAAAVVQPWVKPTVSPAKAPVTPASSGVKSSVTPTPTPSKEKEFTDPVPLIDSTSHSEPSPSPRVVNMLNNKTPAPTFNSPDRSYVKPASPKSSFQEPAPSVSSNTTPVSSSITPAGTPNTTSLSAPASHGSVTKDQSPPRSVGGGKPLFPTKPILLPICKACKQEIRGAYVGAQGRAWHSEHFKCCDCSGDLSQGFKEVEEQLFCGPCYFDKFGEKCVNCGQAVAGPVIQALGKSYHPEHFTCAQCSMVLTDGFNVDNGKPYCNKCHTNFLPDCAGCGKKIEGAVKWISALDKDWHNGCFTCHICRAPLAGKTFFHDSGKALCQLHANAASVNKS